MVRIYFVNKDRILGGYGKRCLWEELGKVNTMKIYFKELKRKNLMEKGKHNGVLVRRNSHYLITNWSDMCTITNYLWVKEGHSPFGAEELKYKKKTLNYKNINAIMAQIRDGSFYCKRCGLKMCFSTSKKMWLRSQVCLHISNIWIRSQSSHLKRSKLKSLTSIPFLGFIQIQI